jgi:predicted dehydrogenase
VSERRLRLAISGAGAIAERAHLPAFKLLPSVEIVAIQGRSKAKPERLLASLWSEGGAERPRAYSDFSEMLDHERPDAVAILGPNHVHCDFTLKALSAGTHVLVEKPMTTNSADARKVVAAAKQFDRVVMVAFQRRFSPAELIVKEAVSAGAIGQPNFLRMRFSHGGPELWAPGQNWFFSESEAGGGALLDLGIHIIDLALWMMGPAISVVAETAKTRERTQVEDSGAVILKFASGAIGVIEASWSSMPGITCIEIYGDKGRIMMGYPRLDITVQQSDGTEVAGYSRDEIRTRIGPVDYFAPIRTLAKTFVQAAQRAGPSQPNAEDGMRAVEAIEAAYLSAATGARVKLPL